MSTNGIDLNEAGGSSASFQANSNTTWKVISATEWLSVNPASGVKGIGQINVSAKENSGPERSGKIMIKAVKFFLSGIKFLIADLVN